MPEKSKIRATSASHQPYQQQRTRRSSFDNDSRKTYHHPTIAGSSIVLPVVDLRTLPQKIEDLETEMLELKNDKNSEQELHHLVLMQVYCNLQYGDISIENVRAYLNLSKYYYHRKLNYLAQAKFHALNARDIFEQLNIKSNNEHLNENLLAYEIYLLLVQCSLNAKQREKKTKNKHILAIDKTHIDHDLRLMKKYLENLQHLMASDKYKKFYFEYLFLKFDAMVLDVKRFNQSITEIIDEIVKYLNNNNIKI